MTQPPNMPQATPATAFTRRRWLGSALGLAAPMSGLFSAPASAHDSLGPVAPPRPAPALRLTLHNGAQRSLPLLLRGRFTALQLMFTTCSNTCPIQGAVFAALQGPAQLQVPGAQLLSVSINPLADDARALAAWRQRLGAQALWLAAAPPLRHADALLNFVNGRRASAQNSDDPHTAQTYLFDQQGRLAYRCAELAGPQDVLAGLRALARQA